MSKQLVACAFSVTGLLLVPRAVAADRGNHGIIGGSEVPVGRYRDVAAVLEDGQAVCTGTLVAPDVVLTAGHCNGPDLNAVLLGTNSLTTPGEMIDVESRFEYPGSQSSFDVTVLVLAHPTQIPPRAIATGWASIDIKNGATVGIAGYGSIDMDGNDYVDEMLEATTTITDADCSASSGCNSSARPAGELGAGGMGIDTCPGDSGGPLFLETDYGEFLAGITSRGYDDSQFYCGEGGIYVRPDAIIDWIEEQAGHAVTRGPEPTYDELDAVNGDGAQTDIDVNDPKSDDHTFAITRMPAHGTAAINDDGQVRVCTDATYQGTDSIGVTITDADDPSRALTISVPIYVEAGDAPASCSLEFVDEGGCCDSGQQRPGGALALAGMVGLVALRRRRR